MGGATEKSDGPVDAGGGTGPTGTADSRTLSEGAQQDNFRKWVKQKIANQLIEVA